NVVADGAHATITLVATFRNRRAKAILIYRRTDTRRTPQLGSDTPRLRARSNSSVKETDMPIENCQKMDAWGMPIQKCLAPHGPVNRRRRLRAERQPWKQRKGVPTTSRCCARLRLRLCRN